MIREMYVGDAWNLRIYLERCAVCADWMHMNVLKRMKPPAAETVESTPVMGVVP
jgi:hypothetical protein